MGQMDELRAQARALANEEKNEQLIINHGNVESFKDTLEDDLREFFESLAEYDRKAKEWQKQRKRLDAKIKEEDYATARVALEELYSLVY